MPHLCRHAAVQLVLVQSERGRNTSQEQTKDLSSAL